MNKLNKPVSNQFNNMLGTPVMKENPMRRALHLQYMDGLKEVSSDSSSESAKNEDFVEKKETIMH